MLLEGKSVIVTGGNTGIGEAIVRAAAAEGANIVIDFIENADTVASLVSEVEALGVKAVAIKADVSKVDDIQKLIDAAVSSFGRVDVFVNNAGIEMRKSLLKTTEEQYDRVMDVNIKSAFFGTQLAAKQFIAQKSPGVVVNMSSVHEDWPMPGNIAYCVSKGGTRMLARTAGVELGEHGIRVFNVAPGAVETPINASTMEDPKKLKTLNAAIPLGRMATSAEIADLVVFLCSDRASYVTATTVVVDGGIMQGSVGL